MTRERGWSAAYTPDELREASRVFAETGSWTKAADAVGRDRSGLRKALIRNGAVDVTRREIHRRACADGIRRARRKLAEGLDRAEQYLRVDLGHGVGLEPKDYAAILNSVSKASDSLLKIDAHHHHVDEVQARIRRLAAETAIAEAKAKGDIPDLAGVVISREQMAELVRGEFGNGGALDLPPAAKAGADSDGSGRS